ncbi:NAD(P)H-dependent flavin oxidoreductase [Roseibium sp.]|uniref:NAD(P)H-dependent flavin oxidoreductase n=1 Tax=Roseibium sp. TaxID=1936156 RepID=UPI003B525CCE
MRKTIEDLSLDIPVFQAPMAGTSTPALAAAVANAGGLGALGLGAASVETAAKMIAETAAMTGGPINLNFFCHKPMELREEVARDWIARSKSRFERFEAAPPNELHEIYQSFVVNQAMFELLLESAPAVASFHFGLPAEDKLAALRDRGIMLIASAVSLEDARRVEAAGIDAVVAQGWSAGGHRGLIDENGPDERLDTEALTRLLAKNLSIPVIAAGGLMDGADVRASLSWGAEAAQLGTAFIGCPETAADDGFRARLAEGGKTVMTRAISGRPARCLDNEFTKWTADVSDAEVPAYPYTYDLGKALNAAAKAKGEPGYGAQWAGSEASRARFLPAAKLMQALKEEFEAADADVA